LIILLAKIMNMIMPALYQKKTLLRGAKAFFSGEGSAF
jgi:hypothetical protein